MTAEKRTSHWIQVRSRKRFLHRLMMELAGDAMISLEGDLSRCRFPEAIVVSRQPLGLLARSTIAPVMDFAVLRLYQGAWEGIYWEIMSAGLRKAIIHVQIVREDALELGAYDNFHGEAVLTGPGVAAELLEEMRSDHVIRSFEVAIPWQLPADRDH